MNKQTRHLAIRRLIRNGVVSNQDELRQLLEEEGFETTQATLSRDLKELGVARTHTTDGPRYVLPGDVGTASSGEENRLASLLAYEIDTIDANECMVVIRTRPGRAAGVADIIDSFGLEELLGTVAGDNTIFLTPKSVKRIRTLLDDLRRAIEGEGR